MGNWRSVEIVGTCGDVAALKAAITVNDDYSNFHCLSDTRSLSGLGDWSGEQIHAKGNLAERDYTIEDVAEQLNELWKIVPSLDIKIHCGGDYEDKECINTILMRDGMVVIGEPEIEEISELSDAEMVYNLKRALTNQLQNGHGYLTIAF